MRSAVAMAAGGVVLSAALAAGGAAGASQNRAGVQAAPSVFRRALEIRLPQGSNAGSLRAVECLRQGSCVAGGDYFDSRSLLHPMIVTESGGRWARARSLPMPKGTVGEVTAIDCTGFGNCVAGGDYQRGATGAFRLFAVTQRAGRWGRISTLRMPSNATTVIALGAIACLRRASCQAVGTYDDGKGDEGWAAVMRAGRWRQASEIRPPAGANAIAGVWLYSVTCTRPGTCVATGFYYGRPFGSHALAVIETGGRWRQAVQVRPPPGAASFGASLFSVVCPRVRICEAAGGYSDTPGQGQKMVATESGGRWLRARAVNVWPTNMSNAVESDRSFKSIACARTGSCVAVGPYFDTAGGQPSLVATESGGRWTGASEVGLPANAATGAKLGSDADAVDCTSTGYCAIVGDYRDRSGVFQALAATTR